MLTWTKRLVLGTLLVALLAVIVVLVAIHTDWGRDQIRARIEAAMNDALPGGAKLGRLEGSVFGELVLHDIEINALDGKPAITIGTLTIDAALKPLLDSRVVVDRIVAEHVVVIDPQRPLAPPSDEPDDAAADDEPIAWSVSLPSIELKDARVSLSATATGGPPITLDRLSLKASAQIPAGAPLTAQLTELKGHFVERRADFSVTAKASLGEVPEVESFVAQLGGVRIDAVALVGDLTKPSGTLTIEAPAKAVAALVPEVALPGDAKLTVTVSRVGSSGAAASDALVQIIGTVGTSQVNALIRGAFDLDTRTGRADAVVFANGADLAGLTRGAVAGNGSLLAVLHGNQHGIHGMLHAHSALAEQPPAAVTLALDATLAPNASAGTCDVPVERASAQILVAGEGGLALAGVVEAKQIALEAGGCRLAIVDEAKLAGSVIDPRKASAGLADASGRLEVAVGATGSVLPTDIAFAGTVGGKRVRVQDLYVGAANAKLAGTFTEDLLAANVTASASGVVRAGKPLGRAVARADVKLPLAGRRAPIIVANATAYPATTGVKRVVAGATITLPVDDGDETVIALGSHELVLASGVTWAGRGGRVRLGECVVVEKFETKSGTGRLLVDAEYDAANAAMTANVEAVTLPASLIDPQYRGTASGTIALQQRGIRWDGSAKLEARGMALKPDAVPLDGDLVVTVDGRHVVLDASARTSRLGKVQFVLDVDGPRDLLDVRGWQRLERKAVRTASVRVDKVDLAEVNVPTGGFVDGKLYFMSGVAIADKNELRVSKVVTPVGTVEGTLAFAQDNDELGAAGNAHIEGVGDANLTARFVFPDRPFDPLAWQRLGRGVARELVLVVDDVVIDPVKLAQLGVIAPYHGRADIQIGLHPGTGEAKLAVDLRELYGKPLAKALDLEIRATSNANGTTASVTLIDPTMPPRQTGLASVANVTAHRDLVTLAGSTPVTFDRWLTEKIPVLLRSPLTGSFDVQRLEAKRLLAYFGRIDGIAGSFGGHLDIRGTLGVPTVNGALSAKDVEGPPGIEGGRPPKLEELKLAIEWGGVAGKIVLTGKSAREAGRSGSDKTAGGDLYASVSGQPGKLETLYGTVKITKFDLAPIAALMPGAFAATTGTLEGDISLSKLDPKTMQGLNGWMRLTNARIPTMPILGTLQDADAYVSYNDKGLHAVVSGPERDAVTKTYVARIGQRGRVWLEARGPRNLATLDAEMRIHDLQMIGEVEPIITAKAVARLVRQGKKWVGRIDVTNASAIVPPETGEDLVDPDAPTDLYIVEDGVKLDRKPVFVLGARAPDDPFLVVDVNLAPTKLDAAILDDFHVRAQIRAALKVSLGETLGVRGRVGFDYGNVDVVGRNYTIDPDSNITFDNGTTNGKLDLTIAHDFPSMTLTAKLGGRIATPDPHFYSDQPNYEENQLLGFFLGGDPGGDTAAQTREAATGAGAALLGSRIAKRLKRVLPVRLDLIRCDPGNSAAGASCTIGRWLSDTIFVAFKSRLEARPDENSGDLQLQWHFKRGWLIEGVGGDRNHNGVDLLWRHRW